MYYFYVYQLQAATKLIRNIYVENSVFLSELGLSAADIRLLSYEINPKYRNRFFGKWKDFFFSNIYKVPW